MIDLIKKAMLAGIGATVVTKETIEKQLDELVEKGKLTRDEARETAEKITEQGRAEYERVKEDTERFTEELLQRGNLVTRSQFESLQERIAELEKRVPADPAHRLES